MKKIGPSAACFIRGLPICRRDVMLFFLLFFFFKCRDYHKAAAFLKPPFSQGGVWLGNGENVMRRPGVQSEVLNLFRGCAVASSAAYIFFMSHTRTVSCSRAIFSSQVIWPACHGGRWKTLRNNMQLQKKKKRKKSPVSHWVQIEGHLVSIRQGRPRLTASSADGICVPSQSARAKAKHKRKVWTSSSVYGSHYTNEVLSEPVTRLRRKVQLKSCKKPMNILRITPAERWKRRMQRRVGQTAPLASGAAANGAQVQPPWLSIKSATFCLKVFFVFFFLFTYFCCLLQRIQKGSGTTKKANLKCISLNDYRHATHSQSKQQHKERKKYFTFLQVIE